MSPTPLRRVRLLAGASLAACLATTCWVSTAHADTTPAPTPGVVLSEVYGGGGNSGATWRNDFVELANRTGASAGLDGWSVQYLPGTPGATSKWGVTPLSGSVDAGAAYLVGEAAGSGGNQDLPTPQAAGTLNLSASSGTVALVRSTTALTCRTAADCASDPDVVDLVGYGSAVVHEGDADAPAGSATQSLQRTRGGDGVLTDTGQNGTDLVAGDPTPGTLPASTTPTDPTSPTAPTSPASPTAPAPGPVRIHDIQSTSWISPLDGQQVTNVPGVVTGVRTTGSRGYWIQDPTPDADATTSEAIFVHTSGTPAVAVGDSVLVSGKVANYYQLGSGQTVSNTSNLSVTEISATAVTTLARGVALPAPIVLTPTTVPDVYAPDLGGSNIESTPITPSRSALDYYRSIEGMRVEIDNARVVGPSDKYGEQYVTSKPTQAVTLRGGTELLGENRTPSGRIEVAANDGTNPQVNVADVFGGATIGEIDWSQYGGFLIAADTLGSVQRANLAPVVAHAGAAKQMSVATYNVENLAPSDPDTKFAALGKGVVTNLASPDVVALEEVQDNSGSTDDGTVAADQTLAKLTAAIHAAGGPAYQAREIDPVNDQDGGQPGGNIRTVFLFNPARVQFVDAGAASTDRSATGTQVVKQHGRPALTLSPGRIDPTNAVWSSSRKPLVGDFRFRGQDVFVIANHFDAKLGDQNADGRFQYPAQASATQRAGQASVEHRFIDQLLAVDRKADVVVVGDLNDYQFSPALNVLRTGNAAGTGSATLTDLITTLPVNQQYTYVYDGISEVLDHILVTRGPRNVGYQVVHINAEYANQTSDHDPQVTTFTP